MALDAGLLELVEHQIHPHGELLVCREPASERYYVAERPLAWSRDEEEQAVHAERVSGAGVRDQL